MGVMKETARTHTFENGLRLIQIPSPTNVAYCGISIDAGTRDEEVGEEGMAHFCEHMMFKGTEKRKAWHIINRMEAVGGDLNAYTNKEETVVYSAFMKEHFERAAELIFDRFEDLIYEGNSLGHDILGTAENVRRFQTADALKFVKRLYRPEKMVFFAFGDVEFEKAKKVVGKRNSSIDRLTSPTSVTREAVQTIHPGTFTEERGTHQAHVMIGRAGYGSEDDKRIALYFLNNILGGPGMNSRLNIALREHKGLVYTVESSLTNYTDTSTWAIYFGCDEEDVEKCQKIVRRELDKLMNEPLTDRQFQAALKQIKGQIGVACDNFENYVLDMAKAYLHYNKFEGMKDTIEHLEKVTPQLLQEVAREMFDEKGLTTLIFRS